jgi:hypothetical protein
LSVTWPSGGGSHGRMICSVTIVLGWEAFMDVVFAYTTSDSAGRYLLCGLPDGRINGIYADRQGSYNPSYMSVDQGGDTVADVEIK